MQQHAENKQRRRLLPSGRALANIGSLAAIQVSNALAPLVIYPFVLTMVGQHNFAQIVVAEAVALFLQSFVLYSFEIDGVAAVVGLDPQKDGDAISDAFIEVSLLRIIFYTVGLAVIQLVLAVVNPSLCLLVLGWSLAALSFAVQPNWLYQGLEHNLPVAVCVLLSRLAALASVFLLIRSEEQYVLLPFILGGWYLVGGAAAGLYAIRHFSIRWKPVDRARLPALIWHGKEVFLGNIATGLYRDSNVLILSALGVPAAGIASYSLAEKLTKALQAGMRPLNQFFFPKALAVAKREGAPTRQALRGILKLTLPQVAITIAVIAAGAGAYLLLSPFIPVLRKIDDVDVVFDLTLIMSFSVLSGVSVFMLGSAGLNALGARGYMFLALLVAAATSVVSNLVLVPYLGATGSAICFVLSETLLLALIVRRYLATDSRSGSPS